MFAVSFDPGSGRIGTPVQLFEDDYLRGNTRIREWDVTADGERFIMIKAPEDGLPRRLVMVQNFFEVLRERFEN